MWVMSRVGVLEGLFGGSVLGLIRVVILVCVREWGAPVRLVTIGKMSICVPGQCERSAFARGVYFSMIWWVPFIKVIICALIPFSYLNFTNTGIFALRGSMADEAGF
jgi:hypothetical protein